MDRGCGMQVVDVVASNSYALNEEALRPLLHKSVRDLPVAVVSVAGAFRGGKSFLLDFCLRYLNATDADRCSNDWMGRHQDPLVGFDWRTGDQRNTIGIHIWSQPFITTMPSGETVAVLLMDTQGTFDNESTVQESTTIFALSMLLSSVQVYNLTGNLGGDDLQHLQLFTEYARLLLDDAEQPFQNIKFLIRDWMFTSSEPFGAEGGRSFLERVLQVRPEQPAQQQEIRKHLRSCFQEIECYLMAHPGFTVSDPNFNGCLADLRAEFVTCLSEFIPLLLAPEQLVPKRINGQCVTAQELVVYFRTYVDLFNSGELPTPATMLQATAEASLLLAKEAARASYASKMEACAGDKLLTTTAVYDLHAEAVAAARELFTSRRIMGCRQKINEALTQIIQELEGRLQDFVTVNEAKMSEALDNAIKAYVEQVLGGSDEQQLCVSPGALAAAHKAAVAATVADFKAKLCSEGEDKVTQSLIKDLDARHNQMVHINDLNNSKATSQALDVYISEMDKSTNGGLPSMTSQQLSAKHSSAREAARNFLKSQRNRFSDQDQCKDDYFQRLDKDIETQYVKLVELNKTANETIIVTVVAFYKDSMSAVMGREAKCLPPGVFNNKENDVRKKAIDMYHAKRNVGANQNNDGFLDKILEVIRNHFDLLKNHNEHWNYTAVLAGCAEYRTVMAQRTGGLPVGMRPIASLFIPCRVLQLTAETNGFHSEAQTKAIEMFKSYRYNGEIEANDTYYNNMIQQIQATFNQHYADPMQVVSRDMGWNGM